MLATTVRTNPLSLTQARPPFRAGNASARGAGLGGKPLVNFDAHCPPSDGFVLQHVSERRPARIKDGLRESRLCEAGGVHVAYGDESVFPRDAGAFDVQEVPTTVRDLGIDGLDASLVAGALRLAERDFMLAVDAWRFNGPAIAQGGKGFEAKVDADFAGPGHHVIGDFAGERRVPAAARILHERAANEVTTKRAMLPERIPALEVRHAATEQRRSARDVRYPSQRLSIAETCPESRAATMLVAGPGELPADLRDGIGVDAQQRATAGAELAKVNPCRPSTGQSGLSASFGFPLRGNEKVPDLIALDSHRVEALDSGLDAVLVCQDAHAGSVLCSNTVQIKSASHGSNRAGRSHSSTGHPPIPPRRERRSFSEVF